MTSSLAAASPAGDGAPPSWSPTSRQRWGRRRRWGGSSTAEPCFHPHGCRWGLSSSSFRPAYLQSPDITSCVPVDHVELVKRTMAAVALPSLSVPSWAKEISDDQWEDVVQKALQSRQSAAALRLPRRNNISGPGHQQDHWQTAWCPRVPCVSQSNISSSVTWKQCESIPPKFQGLLIKTIDL